MDNAGPERTLEVAGLRTVTVGVPDAPLALVLLHGYSMSSADLSPFAHSLGIPAFFLLPQGPVTTADGGHAWWAVDEHARASALSAGPRDLTHEYPLGLSAARDQLRRFVEEVDAKFQPRRLVVGGFSQGGMLALDWVLHGTRHVDGIVLLSASRLAENEWRARQTRLRNLPVFVSHGSADRDLALAAGEGLRDFVLESEAQLTWVPFDGGHEIPLVVWRGLRKFLRSLVK